ncbi:BTB/POZ domain-containing protein POB1 [Amborella trichopoda]|nr:BTB/POZ domain-containing protein POB1 [Amborella trichopoda]XP_020529471.1 BTB/POZ domain-containing protein POB1 [Amborella trichopoda]|eukprot:XP_020529470.1 BTB/POZ domain-containing protein POB1 [Amborella trichopoda]
MYSGLLSSTTAPALLRDLLVVADKFDVASCVCHCTVLLGNLHMTQECALLYLEHPDRMIDAMQPLAVAAKQFLAKKYQDLFEFHDELMALPLSSIKAVLSSNELHLGLEDVVFDFALEWARANYPNLEERHEIWGLHLAPVIRFSDMSTHKLKEVFECEELDLSIAFKIVAKALLVKAEELKLKQCVTQCAKRHLPVKVIELAANPAKCLVFFDLRQEECAALFPKDYIDSQLFYLNGNAFYLSLDRNIIQGSSTHCCGLYHGM